jgi:hypothetical protein
LFVKSNIGDIGAFTWQYLKLTFDLKIELKLIAGITAVLDFWTGFLSIQIEFFLVPHSSFLFYLRKKLRLSIRHRNA